MSSFVDVHYRLVRVNASNRAQFKEKNDMLVEFC